MASTFTMFDREIKLATADLEPAAIQRTLAAYARQSVAEMISSGQAPARYERFVNNRAGASEESVQLPGPIVYVFTNWKLVIETALTELKRRVPSGKSRRSKGAGGKGYKDSFLVVVGGRVVVDYASIQPDAEVIILNSAPYTRKMEVGGNKTGARHFDLTEGVLRRRFNGAFDVGTKFLKVTGGIDPRIPYILKGQYARRQKAILANPKKHEAEIKAHLHHRRKSLGAGEVITYPALVINSM
jgi:hypothetical protein